MSMIQSGTDSTAQQRLEPSEYDGYRAQGTLTPGDFLKIISRRKWSILIPAVMVIIIAAIIALALEPVYRSSSTILIEEQEIPSSFVMATISSFAEQRIQSINQRIMSTSRLLEIINQNELYRKLREKRTTEEVIARMRDDVKLKPISAEVVDKATGRPTTATIAFSLSYEGKDSPQTIQKVANVLTSLYLEENIKDRERQTQETYEFLEVEAERMKEQLMVSEARIAEFKEEHINELPELLPVSIQSLNNVEQHMDRLSEQLRSLKERESYLQAQLTSISPKFQNRDRDRINELRVQMAFLSSRFTDEYPDVIKAKEEIERLEKSIQSSQSEDNATGERPENPAYVTLSSQLASTVAEIESVNRQTKAFEEKAADYRRRIELTPQVEATYQQLSYERNNAHSKYNDLLQKAMEARVAQGLEKKQKGERFTLIDPPRLPEKPFKPNRLAIMIVGVVLGLAAGGGMATVKELSDQTVRDPEVLSYATGVPVLASIPVMLTDSDRRRKRDRRAICFGAGIFFLSVGLVMFHFFVMDMDILWIRLMRRITRGI